jgi:glycosyltransferase involved in cell wall biosynthesis
LRDAGHEVAISSNYGGDVRVHDWEGITVLPPGEDRWAQDSLARDVVAMNPDLTITLYDAWVLRAEPLKDALVATWAPIDHNPLPPMVAAAVRDIDAIPIAYSRFGEASFAANGFDPLFVPHGIDCNTYQPRDQAKARELLGLPADAFLVGMVAANKSAGYLRKGWDVAFESFAWLQRNFKNAHLYAHTKPASKMGIDLTVCASNYGVPGESLTFLPAGLHEYGISDERMSWVYSAFDVLLAPSLGEGFCLPVLEAQACGVPVIVTDFAATSELCGSGWKAQAHNLYDSDQAADWGRPYDFEVRRCLHEAYEARGDQKLRAEAREFALYYDVPNVWQNYWEPVLAELAKNVPGAR